MVSSNFPNSDLRIGGAGVNRPSQPAHFLMLNSILDRFYFFTASTALGSVVLTFNVGPRIKFFTQSLPWVAFLSFDVSKAAVRMREKANCITTRS